MLGKEKGLRRFPQPFVISSCMIALATAATGVSTTTASAVGATTAAAIAGMGSATTGEGAGLRSAERARLGLRCGISARLGEGVAGIVLRASSVAGDAIAVACLRCATVGEAVAVDPGAAVLSNRGPAAGE